jgi:polyhydroxyalkanoate synthesis regulator phasin
MPAPKSSSSISRQSRPRSRPAGTGKQTQRAAGTQSPPRSPGDAELGPSGGGGADGMSGFVEVIANRIIRQLDLVLIRRERIQEILDDAAERGRVTRTDANQLVSELVRLGRQQTDDFLRDVEQLLERGREQVESATRRARVSDSVDRLVRSAERARRSVGAGSALPVAGYDELTAGQVQSRIKGLTPAELRKVRVYEQRHANRKSVLAAVDKALG